MAMMNIGGMLINPMQVQKAHEYFTDYPQRDNVSTRVYFANGEEVILNCTPKRFERAWNDAMKGGES